MDIDTPDGLRCRTENGDVPAIIVYGGGQGGNQDVLGDLRGNISNWGAGVALVLPLSPSVVERCDTSLLLHESSQKLEIAQRLYDAGLMTEEEVKQIAAKIKERVFGELNQHDQ